jgi:hypothetical protein
MWIKPCEVLVGREAARRGRRGVLAAVQETAGILPVGGERLAKSKKVKSVDEILWTKSCESCGRNPV